MKIFEDGAVRNEGHQGTVLLIAFRFAVFLGQNTSFEFGGFFAAVAEGGHFKIVAESVDGLGTHTVQSDGFLENLAIVFGAGIDLAHHIHHFTERNATAKVADGDGIFFNSNIDLFTVAHGIFVDTVVYHLFNKDVDTIVGAGAIAQFTDIHSRAHTDMFAP